MENKLSFSIGKRIISERSPVFFIAEAGVNHNGSLDLAIRLIDVAKEAGADAVKFQTFKTEKLSTKSAPKSSYHIETTGSDKKQTWFDLLKTQELNREIHIKLIEYCNKNEIIFLSTPYDEESADMLGELNIDAFKLASTDANNLPFIKHIARKKKPIILSTAFCNMNEVIQAVDTIRGENNNEFAILQCTGNYPARIEDSNLRVIQTYRDKLSCLVGYSDHTPEIINPIAAVALGVCIYEKHFTLDKSLPGPDHRMSLSPSELKETIKAIRHTEKALGKKEKFTLKVEQENRKKLRKSLVANRDIKKGTILSSDLIAIKRPGTGLPPSEFDNIIGKEAYYDIKQDTLFDYSMFVQVVTNITEKR